MKNLSPQEVIGEELSRKAGVIIIDAVEPRPVCVIDFDDIYEFSKETLRICGEAPLNKLVENNMEWRKRYARNNK